MRHWVVLHQPSSYRGPDKLVCRTAIDLESSQLLASVKDCAGRPAVWPPLDSVSALAVSYVAVRHMLFRSTKAGKLSQ